MTPKEVKAMVRESLEATLRHMEQPGADLPFLVYRTEQSMGLIRKEIEDHFENPGMTTEQAVAVMTIARK